MKIQQRDRWHALWRLVTSDLLLAAALLGVAAGMAALAWLPQLPTEDPAAYSRWLAQVQTRFGGAAQPLRFLGLFTVRQALGFRLPLAVLAGCLVARAVEQTDRLRVGRRPAQPVGEWTPIATASLNKAEASLRRARYRVLSGGEADEPWLQADRWPWAELAGVVTHAAPLLILMGGLATTLWGWRVEDLVARPGETIELPMTGQQLELQEMAGNVQLVTPGGILARVEGTGPGVRASARNADGRLLTMHRTVGGPTASALTLTLTIEQRDAYFALPEAGLVVRLALEPGSAVDADVPLELQVYRSPSGQLALQTLVEEDIELAIGETRLTLTRAPYIRLSLVHNPGAWPTGLGILLMAVSVGGVLLWPVRRVWVKEGRGGVAAAGDIPLGLVQAGKQETTLR